MPLLFPAAVVAVAANDKVVAICAAIGATLVDAVLAAATAFFAAVTAVVLSCCCSLQALRLLLLLLSLVYVLSLAAYRAPKSPPVVWCLHRSGTCTSCLVVGTSTHMCVYVCARSQTITDVHIYAIIHLRVHVSIHTAVSIAPLAESYLVFAVSECSTYHG